MDKVFGLFSDELTIDEAITKLDARELEFEAIRPNDAMADSNTPLALGAPTQPFGAAEITPVANSQLDTLNLDDNVARFFSQQLNSGTTILMVDADDVDAVKAIIEDANGRVWVND